MTKESASNDLTFARACEYLSLSPDDFVTLREQGLVACLYQSGKQIYPTAALDITGRLLTLGQGHDWGHTTLAWYADLVFATEVGRSILLPMIREGTPSQILPASWLETPYISAVLNDLDNMLEEAESPLIMLLRSLMAATVGDGQFWSNHEALESSALYPIISHFESLDILILDQGRTISRDAGPILQSLLHTFVTIAPPISRELEHLIREIQIKIQGRLATGVSPSGDEQALIMKEARVAVDKIYASKVSEIHTPPETWDIKLGVVRASRQTIALQLKFPVDSPEDVIDNIIDLIRPYVGPYGARVVHLLYEIANDPPYWRTPLITIDTNDFLDRLGVKRDSRGIHYSRNRERLRDALNTAHYLEIIGEYTTWENGKSVVKALRRSVLSLIGATFDPEDRQGLATSDLFQSGLPKSMQIRLNFYEGVRRQDGRLGNQYVLMPRMADPKALPKANHAATEELLKAYFLFRYRQIRGETNVIAITRETALEKAGITTKNITRATQILRRALDKLVAANTIMQYSPIPLKPHQSFTVEITPQNIEAERDDEV